MTYTLDGGEVGSFNMLVHTTTFYAVLWTDKEKSKRQV